MLSHGLIANLQVTESFFLTTISPLGVADGAFRPSDELYTITGHLQHVADSITWFIDGAFRRPNGFSMDFEQKTLVSQAATDFTACKQMVIDAFSDARDIVSSKSDDELMEPLPEGPIMGGAPKLGVISGIVDHTAHHRGALTVYCRLLGKVPPMPYGPE